MLLLTDRITTQLDLMWVDTYKDGILSVCSHEQNVIFILRRGICLHGSAVAFG